MISDVKGERLTSDTTAMSAAMELEQPPIKMVFLGDSAVGKTALLLRFNTGSFPDENLVPVFDFADRITVDGKTYHINFFDIGKASHDEYDRIRPLLYPDTDIFVLCFDITNRVTFDNIKQKWITEIRHFMPFTPFLLVGNKMDLRKKFTEQVDEPNTVSCQEARELAHLYDTSYVENSSLTGEQVSEVVNTAIRKVAYLRKINSRCRCRRGCFKWIKCKQHK